MQKAVTDFSNGFLPGPSKHPFHTGIPKTNSSIQVADHNGRKINDPCMLIECFLGVLALSDIAQDDGKDAFPVRLDLGNGGFDGKFLAIRAKSVERAQCSHRTPGHTRFAKVLYVSFVSSPKSLGNKAVE